MLYREEAGWNIRIEASAEFAEGYEGELDGYVWRDTLFREVQRRAAAAVLREIASVRGWRIRTGNRGLPATDEILVHVELDTERAEPPRD